MSVLFTPFRVGSVELANRIVIARRASQGQMRAMQNARKFAALANSGRKSRPVMKPTQAARC
jgi:2,4-dienoyl-CoA reductase-like NADH-dependent reductase (Old Yellow Enzyme family)